jgi:DNA-damage-inducible protein D
MAITNHNLKQISSPQDFESIKKTTDDNSEYWYARELMVALGYSKWQEFTELIKRAQSSAEKSGVSVSYHFALLRKMITAGKGAMREIDDYALTRYACYLIAQNGDPRRKEKIALAQTYFAFQTRNQEIQQTHQLELERLAAREKLTKTEKEFSGTLVSRGLSGKEVAEIRALGDSALFGGHTTDDMKRRLRITSKARPLADFLPTITLKAKDLATEMTTFKTKEKNAKNKQVIRQMHTSHNNSVRKALTNEGIYPEKLPAEEDIKKIERRINQNRSELPTPTTVGQLPSKD